MPNVTIDDSFTMLHPHTLYHGEGELTWIVTEFFTSGQGQAMASIQSACGGHAATVPVSPTKYTVTDGAGVPHEMTTAYLNPSSVQTGGAAAVRAKFAAHHALFCERDACRAKGDTAGAAAATQKMRALRQRNGMLQGARAQAMLDA